ncbi:hypothetical protein PG995_015594 [Apiospora arundinis]|uniref:Uncharacterized protein n=1 Tax=Apiospora arundinis TaxID=335852 RepID=A0ABR2IFM8_9PEZI
MDHEADDPRRYAILSVLPSYLVKAFNRLIERGLPRDSPMIIAGDEVERELRERPVVLEEIPDWVTRVPPLSERLVIPNEDGEEPLEQHRSQWFLAKNIMVEEPHVLFV